MASTRRQGKSRAGGAAAGGAADAAIDAAAADDSVPPTCIVCGHRLLASEWLVSSPKGMLHYDCWVDRSNTEQVLTTLPAAHLLQWSDDLKKLRRELRESRSQHDELLAAVLAERDQARDQCAVAVQERKTAMQQRDAALGVSLERLDDDELQALKDKLENTLVTVENWQLACTAVECENPEFVCPIGRALMRDPVSTVDGWTYERKHIEKHFNTLEGDGRVCRSPWNEPLESRRVVANRALKNTIDRFVATKAEEMASGRKSKRARE